MSRLALPIHHSHDQFWIFPTETFSFSNIGSCKTFFLWTGESILANLVIATTLEAYFLKPLKHPVSHFPLPDWKLHACYSFLLSLQIDLVLVLINFVTSSYFRTRIWERNYDERNSFLFLLSFSFTWILWSQHCWQLYLCVMTVKFPTKISYDPWSCM